MLIHDLLDLFFPRTCTLCGNSLFREEELLCMNCRYHLPKSRFIDDPENPVARSFWGRINVEYACSGFHFRKGNAIQKLIHKLKYRGQCHIGEYLGGILWEIVRKNAVYADADMIIPIPLHPKKLNKRGYNQSECIARGFAESSGIRMDTGSLCRVEHTNTQTKKSRYDRWENVSAVFSVRDKTKIRDKSIILLDDVITTGATMEAAGQQLLSAGCKHLSILALASTLK